MNMCFKLNCQLSATGDTLNYDPSAVGDGISDSGTNAIAMPYLNLPGIVNAQNLIDAVNAAGGSVQNIQRFNECTDGLEVYSGAKAQTPFPLKKGEAYFLKMGTGVDFQYTGCHDPGCELVFEATGDGPDDNCDPVDNSASGTNFFAMPYNHAIMNAADLIADIESNSAGSSGPEHPTLRSRHRWIGDLFGRKSANPVRRTCGRGLLRQDGNQGRPVHALGVLAATPP